MVGFTVKEYKGYGIDENIYGTGEYTVQFEGDDYFFDSIDEAEAFIDDMINI